MGEQAGPTQHDIPKCMAFYNVDGFILAKTISFYMFLETQAERGLRPDRARTTPGPCPTAPDRARQLRAVPGLRPRILRHKVNARKFVRFKS